MYNINNENKTLYPPSIGSKINIFNMNGFPLLEGTVIAIISPKSVVVQIKNEPKYIDTSLVLYPEYNFGHGYLVLKSNYNWAYISESTKCITQSLHPIPLTPLNPDNQPLIHSTIKPSSQQILTEAIVKPLTQSSTQPIVKQTSTEAIVKPLTQSSIQQSTQPIVQSSIQPIVQQQSTQPIVQQQSPQSIVQSSTKPIVQQQSPQPIVQQSPQPIVQQQSPQPIVQPLSAKPIVQQQSPQPIVQSSTKPVVQQQSQQPIVQQSTQPIVQSSTKPIFEQQSTQPIVEQLPQPLKTKTQAIIDTSITPNIDQIMATSNNPNINCKPTLTSTSINPNETGGTDYITLEKAKTNQYKYNLTLFNSELFIEDQINDQLIKLQKGRIEYLNTNNFSLQKIVITYTDCEIEENKDTCINYLVPLTPENRVTLKQKLTPNVERANKPLRLGKDEIVVNNSDLTVNQLISYQEQEIAEGTKVMQWIEKTLVYYKINNVSYYVFADLVMASFRGYIYIARGGIKITDNVTKKLVPDITQLTYQIGKPISELALVTKLVETPTYGDMANTKIEVQKILGLENYICLQPQPRFQLFILKKLIMAWYADEELTVSITKIKVIINQYRCRRDQSDNLQLGVLPSILIYLRYGPNNLDVALNRLNFYLTDYKATGWAGNNPDYFIRVDDLIYYSNGSIDAKRYIDRLPNEFKPNIYDPYVPNPKGKLLYGKTNISYYPGPYEKIDKLHYSSTFQLTN
jgi:hypothetical protein